MARSSSTPIIIHRGRTKTLLVDLGRDVSANTFTSEIRTESDVASTSIAEWDVNFVTDGVDGKLVLTLDDTVTSDIIYSNGYMDIKEMVNGEPLSVFNGSLPVVIKGVVTA